MQSLKLGNVVIQVDFLLLDANSKNISLKMFANLIIFKLLNLPMFIFLVIRIGFYNKLISFTFGRFD